MACTVGCRKAYVDQLARSQSLPAQQIADLRRPSKSREFAQAGEVEEDCTSIEQKKRRHGEDPGDSARLQLWRKF